MAEQTFLKAKDAKPNDPDVYMQLAGYYNRQGDFDKTIEALDQRVEHRAEQPRSALHRGHLLLGQGVSRLPAEDKEKLEMVLKGIEAVDKAIADQGRLHGGHRLQEPAAPAAGQPEKDPAKQQALFARPTSCATRPKRCGRRRPRRPATATAPDYAGGRSRRASSQICAIKRAVSPPGEAAFFVCRRLRTVVTRSTRGSGRFDK